MHIANVISATQRTQLSVIPSIEGCTEIVVNFALEVPIKLHSFIIWQEESKFKQFYHVFDS